ncbi:MAG: vitamin B12-dependent ribonucleotide reductase [Myxococcota bacterium]
MESKLLEKDPRISGKKKSSQTRRTGTGLRFTRRFTRDGVHPCDEVAWERRTAVITGEDGKVYFEQRDVEVPKFWSMLATNVVVSKYFRGAVGAPERETSVRQVVTRVAKTIADWGRADGYFASARDAEIFEMELTYLLVNQHMAFNSPVWFNVGIEPKPQASACFINSVQDSMESILGLAKTEGMLFKFGSGTGSNLSTLRSSKERLAGGGTASGPISFMKGFDAFAGAIKSGGKTRRAAKMVILNADHPDVLDFIWCKQREERKAWALIEAGYDGDFRGEAYASVFFQNANHSVRVTDEFMRAVTDDGEWATRFVRDGGICDRLRARDVMRQIADAAWQCADPGLQFDTTINAWHTSPASGRINASNPCSEYMYLDDSACNLASLNLRRFQKQDGELDVDGLRHAVDTTITAMEIIVDRASYPTPKIGENSHKFRPLGLGYANLGALLMSRGLPYDSDAARAYTGAVTALMHGEANLQSARIAEHKGPFAGYAPNREPMLGVMRKHWSAVDSIDAAYVPFDLMQATRDAWQECYQTGATHGYRNGQVTVIAPTGTIAFMMDCDTTGIEPDIALVKYKKLVGGGTFKIVNQTVPEALARLGYLEPAIAGIIEYVDAHETIEGAPGLKDEHVAVFDCAFRAQSGTRSIDWLGHVKMMAAAQPFISGSISKTVNLPSDATIEDIERCYVESWKMGLKCISIYRDGCKRSQPLTTGKKKGAAEALATAEPRPVRRKLPDERPSITHKFAVGGHEGYVHVGLYDDGTPGEIFIKMAKEGSTISGLMDAFATAISLSLQHGVPLKLLVDKFSHMRFEPSGFSENPQIGHAKSIMDYLFRWLGLRFVKDGSIDEMFQEGVVPVEVAPPVLIEARPSNGKTSGNGHGSAKPYVFDADAPACHECGAIMERSGTCHKCANCGSTSGCS